MRLIATFIITVCVLFHIKLQWTKEKEYLRQVRLGYDRDSIETSVIHDQQLT